MCQQTRIAPNWFLALCLVSCVASFALGAPEIRRQYQFIPSKSTVHVTGGFAGADWPLAIDGNFGLVTGYGADVEVPPLDPFARFVDVKATLSDPRRMGPLPMPGWDLDATLNLSGLKGSFQDPSLLSFRGDEGQGWPIQLEATLHGRLLHLTGENDPGCCDFFHYKVDAWAHLTPFADFNWDGLIDRLDAQTLINNFGLASDATFAQGDADSDGDVDGSDFFAWQVDVGAVPEMALLGSNIGASAAAAADNVPEPTTLFLFVCGILLYFQRHHRLRTRP